MPGTPERWDLRPWLVRRAGRRMSVGRQKCRLTGRSVLPTKGEVIAEKVSTTVPLNGDEVYFKNCPMVSANNIDQDLGWCREEFKKIGVEYAYLRSCEHEYSGI